MTTRQKSLSKKFFTKSKSEELEEEGKEHYENSRDDVDSLTIKKEEGLGIKKNRKKLLWDRVKHDNAKIKKLKEVNLLFILPMKKERKKEINYIKNNNLPTADD